MIVLYNNYYKTITNRPQVCSEHVLIECNSKPYIIHICCLPVARIECVLGSGFIFVAVDRADGVDDVACGQIVTASDTHLTGFALCS